jgi:hypothetical protein
MAEYVVHCPGTHRAGERQENAVHVLTDANVTSRMTGSQCQDYVRARLAELRAQGLDANEIGALAQIEYLIHLNGTHEARRRAKHIFAGLSDRVKDCSAARLVGDSINQADRQRDQEHDEGAWFVMAREAMTVAITTNQCMLSNSGETVIFATEQLGRRDLSSRIGFAMLQMKSAGLDS